MHLIAEAVAALVGGLLSLGLSLRWRTLERDSQMPDALSIVDACGRTRGDLFRTKLS